MLIWGLVLAVHLLGVVAWVGGMMFAVHALHPVLRGLDTDARLPIQIGVFAHFFRVVWVAMPAVLISGYLMLFGFYGGFREVGWTVHCMHMLGLIMAALFVVMARGPWQALRNFPDPSYAAGIRRIVLINLGLGTLTILIASLGHFG